MTCAACLEICDVLTEDFFNFSISKSPLKWAGGKYRVMPKIKELLPWEVQTYYEPFMGGGSVCLNLPITYQKCVVSDTNEPLYYFWKHLKENTSDLIREAKSLFDGDCNTSEVFYSLREEFNTTTDTLRKSAIFVYLNRHCYNGLCRLNSKGFFNVPFGSYGEPHFPEEELLNAGSILQRFEILNQDFRTVFDLVKIGDVVYCDPPYVALSKTASFQSYGKDSFTIKDQQDLVDCAKTAADKGATVLISNHLNNETRKLYKDANCCVEFEVARMISGNVAQRNPVMEMIAVFSKR